MTEFDQLKEQMKVLYAQARLQKGLRLTLRAVWMGMAGTLLGWAAYVLFGWPPGPYAWIGIGLGAALVPITGVLIYLYPVLTDLSPSQLWIYAMDQRLRLREQLSTAWEVAQNGKGGPVAALLVQETLALLPRARAEILKDGWFRKLDLAAAGITALLSCAVLAALLMQPPIQPATAKPAQLIPNTAPQQTPSKPNLPPVGQQPDGSNSQPGASQNGNGASGNSSANNPPNGSQNANNPGNVNGANSGASNPAAANALRQLGKALSRQAGTFDLGQALQNLDMQGAANALQNLKNQLGDLSPESRDNLSQALQNAAKDLNQANMPSIAKDLQDAANALNDPNAAPDSALDKLAQDLSQLDGAMQSAKSGSSSGAGQGQSSGTRQAPPVDRLPDVNGQMEIPQDSPNNSGLLSPAPPNSAGQGTASGSLDASRPQGNSGAQSPLLPSSFLWKWRNVVSQYFRR